MRRGWAAGAAIAAALACLCAGLPHGVTPPPVPADNPTAPAKVELGRRLFYDADLSLDGTLSCSSCHLQHRGFADGNPTHPGVHGVRGRRNVPGLANVAWLSPLTWADPTQKTLEAQVATPVVGDHPVEMGMMGQEAEIARRLSTDACYRRMFADAFPAQKGEISLATTSKAIAAFERTLVSYDAPYDRARAGRGSLGAEARQGQALFAAKGCAACHSGPNFTDSRFHVIAAPGADDGAMEKTGRAKDRGAFRTPSLRNVELTDPYLHDGSARTITFAIFSHTDAARALTPDEAVKIEAFLRTLTDRTFVTNPKFGLPTMLCGAARTN